MYKYLSSNSVVRLSDYAVIPLVAGNRDYEEMQVWIALGNTPAPADNPSPLTKEQRIAEVLASKSIPMTRSEVWNAIIAANALATAQAPLTGRAPAEQLAYNRARNKYQRECEEMEAAIRVIELEP